jgi:hypothetical protein
MDAIIANNTHKYAKAAVAAAAANPNNADKLAVKEIYIVDNPPSPIDAWRAVLIDSYCQAGKTRKCFDVLAEKVHGDNSTLVLFVTQANSLASANQTIQRATTSPIIASIIPPDNIFRSAKAPLDGVLQANYMVVDFWNARNMGNMLNFVEATRDTFTNIIVIIDECEQGSQKGLKDRLSFIRQVEKTSPASIVKVIFITATVANLSKSILQIANANLLKFKTGVVSEIVNKPSVEHQFAQPHDSYVGASWFKNTPGVWSRLAFPRKDADMSKEEYTKLKEIKVMKAVKALPDAAKELTLIVTSTRTNDHKSLAERLYRSGYNVAVEMNGTNHKNFKVNYVDKSGGISTWDIPYSQIDARADHGDLETFRNSSKKLVNSGISQKDDYTMSHILQAALFMMTDEEARIKANIADSEFNKLDAISNAITNLDKSLRRPNDFPEKPRVALIAGHLAGRGITIQNPFIDFTCTSFCFTDTRDVIQRGATNTQRFGRACGMLMDVFARQNKKPFLIATDGIMQDALANEQALKEKAEAIENGTLISLKDMVSKDEWDRIVKQTKKDMKDSKTVRALSAETLIDGVSPTALKQYYKSKNLLIGKMIRYLYQINRPVTFQEFKNGIGYEKSDKQFQNNIHNARSVTGQYGKIWIVSNDTYKINPALSEIISNIK